jgi:hypothetical protein
MVTTSELTDWLLDGPPWAQYHTYGELLGLDAAEPEVEATRNAILAEPKVEALLEELMEWPGAALTRHNDAKHAIHKLAFLADLGLLASDPVLEPILEKVLAHRSKEGVFQIIVNIPRHFGGSGEDDWQWMLCDASTTLYALLKLGLEKDPHVAQATSHLAGLVRENGWPCAAASELGKFRGPGRAGDPCPYTNLIMLKALAQSPEWHESQACKTAAGTLLRLWEVRREQKPYLFAMGTHFAKLKAPLIWYDLLHVLEVLSQFHWLQDDPRLREMVALLESKADSLGRFTPESIWMAWKGWDFGQKKEPSRWVTLIAQRILRRLNM